MQKTKQFFPPRMLSPNNVLRTIAKSMNCVKWIVICQPLVQFGMISMARIGIWQARFLCLFGFSYTQVKRSKSVTECPEDGFVMLLWLDRLDWLGGASWQGGTSWLGRRRPIDREGTSSSGRDQLTGKGPGGWGGDSLTGKGPVNWEGINWLKGDQLTRRK